MDATNEIKKYIDEKRELRDLFITYMESSDDYDNDFNELIKFIQTQKFEQDREEFEHFLRLILNICNNHHRYPGFFDKIKQIF